MGFSRQEYSNGLPFPSPRDIPNPGVELLLHCQEIFYRLLMLYLKAKVGLPW